MKKFVSLIIVALLCLSFCSCAEKTHTEIEPADYNVRFQTDEFDENGCHVTLSYPVVSGLQNDAEINDLLYAYVYNRYKIKCLVSESGDVEFNYTTLNTAVTYSMKGYFCALIFVEYYSDNASHNMREGFAVHCDTAEARIYSSSDIINDFGGIKKQFTAGKFSEQYGMTDLTSVVSYEDLIAQYDESYDLFPQIYFEDGVFAMNIDVVHLYGGYAGFATDIGNVSKYLNKEIRFVATICGE